MAIDSGTLHRSFKSNHIVQYLFNRQYDQSKTFKYANDLVRTRFELADNLYRKDLFAHFGCVNAIEFSDNGKWMVSGGDDRRVLLWNVEKAISGAPGEAQMMKGEHNSNIFCLGFDSNCSRLFSAGNDELVMIHDTRTGETLDVILHNDAIYGLSVDPIDDNVFASACDNGRVCLWDVRGPGRDPFILARYSTAFHAVMYNPFESRMIATANAKEGVALWDVRKPRCVLQQFNSSLLSSQSSMSVRFNKQGNLILALRRRLPPVLYNLTSQYPIAEFDNIGYYNSCTMKSCCFGGDSDQYVLSGSDDFKLYLWKVPDQFMKKDFTQNDSTLWIDNADLVLKGHRSIVNQVRYNYANHIIASSGVEKVIKFWSPFPLPKGSGSLQTTSQLQKENRKVFSHEDYINLVLESGQFVTHDYSHQSVQEDSRMMAFFDSLVQRDIEGWTSDSSDDSFGCSSSFYELGWNTTGHSDESNFESNSSDYNSDVEELKHSHVVSYINVLTKRFQYDLSDENERRNLLQGIENQNNGQEKPLVVVNNTTKNKETNLTANDVNRITKLITEKKRDQLKKITKITVRAAKRHIKKRNKHLLKKPKKEANPEENEIIKKQLSFLSQQVEVNNEDKNNKNISRRIHKRLRFLTNQSDLVFNEVLPTVSSSSDSESNLSDDDFFELQNGDRNSPVNDNESDIEVSSDSSKSNYENLLDHVQKEVLSESSDEDEGDKTNDAKSEETGSKRKDAVYLSHVNNYIDNPESSDDENGPVTSHSHDQLVHCPYKHNLCHASTSSSTQATDLIKRSINFKPIDSVTTRRRFYRTKKSSSSSEKTRKEDSADKSRDCEKERKEN